KALLCDLPQCFAERGAADAGDDDALRRLTERRNRLHRLLDRTPAMHAVRALLECAVALERPLDPRVPRVDEQVHARLTEASPATTRRTRPSCSSISAPS